MRIEFINAIKSKETAFGLKLSDEQVKRLADYFDLVQEHNALLHLVGPCPAEEFALRHILESLTLLEHLPKNSQLVDVGAGAGLPSIPCLIVREDLRAILVDSKEKKTRFLENAVRELDLADRVKIVNRQFEEADPADSEYVTCRALDKFARKLSRLLKWAGDRRLLLFGGGSIADALSRSNRKFETHLLPLSKQRFLFVVDK